MLYRHLACLSRWQRIPAYAPPIAVSVPYAGFLYAVYNVAMNMKTIPQTGQRGPAEHSIRDQIIVAADSHFSYYGYGKTTVSDLAKAIGFSKAYIYKFFPSKQAIGEAICQQCLDTVLNEVQGALQGKASAAERLRTLFMTIANASTNLFFHERRLYDIVIYSTEEKWPTSQAYLRQVRDLLATILQQGREDDEFERETPLDEQCRAIFLVMEPFVNPLMLQYKLDGISESIEELMRLILRGLTV